MKRRFGDQLLRIVPVVIVLAGVILVWFAPAEQTLGQGIKVVYVHVALMWVGMAGLALAGMLGAWIAVVPNARSFRLDAWMDKFGWVALGLFIAGVVISFLAAKINWGAVSLREPRTEAGMIFSAVALIVKIVGGWLPSRRLRGALHALLMVLVVWSTVNTPLVLHPKNPVGASSSSAIQFAFIGLSVLTALLFIWIVWYWQIRTSGD